MAPCGPLPPSVQVAIASLPPNDREVFTYIAFYNIALYAAGSQRFPAAKKKGAGRNKKGGIAAGPNHRPNFDCECLKCYLAFQELLDKSPNAATMHQALDLNDACTAVSFGHRRNRGRDRDGQDDDPKKKKLKDSPEVKSVKLKSKQVAPLDSLPEQDEQEGQQHDQEQQQQQQEQPHAQEPPQQQQQQQQQQQDQEQPQQQQQHEAHDPARGRSLGSRLSELVGYFWDRMLRLWYRRLRRIN